MFKPAIVTMFCLAFQVSHTSCLNASVTSSKWTPLASGNLSENSSEPTIQPSVRILTNRNDKFDTQNHSYLITHGFGGTLPDDRFHTLAQGLADNIPNANVLILDWSGEAWETDFFGMPAPTKVAVKINPVADHFAQLLRALGLNISKTTLIGESFGNCINARIAQQLGSEGRFLVFNPPSPLGGYPLPDVTPISHIAWSFHTYSAYDSTELKTDAGFYLECPEEMDHHGQHTRGIPWLTEQLIRGNLDWINFRHQVPARQEEVFDGTADILGNFLATHRPRRLQEPSAAGSRSKRKSPNPPSPERNFASMSN
ncbi:MAG: hypothetical protein JNL58_02585 [Planctomyces sp.]|nr:hypothetical protein [Planctomyces sp.]